MLAAAAAVSALVAFAPVVVHDRAERFPLTSVAGKGSPAAYGRAVPARRGGTWLQYWLFYAYQDQDRGIVRSGRHVGDWELVQYRLDAAGRPVEAVYAQHGGGERCGWREVETQSGRPVVYVAHGSHASYFRSGTRDRMWPDPNDEADGRGIAIRPRVVEIAADKPRWMTDDRPWGPSRASPLVPPEQDSPLGPAHQPDRWDPDAFAAGARGCQARCDTKGECDAPEKAVTAAAIAFPLAALAAAFGLRRRRSGPRGGARV